MCIQKCKNLKLLKLVYDSQLNVNYKIKNKKKISYEL